MSRFDGTFPMLVMFTLLWAIPIYLVLRSDKAFSYHKIIWFFLTLWFSWLGYTLFYFIVVKHLSIDKVSN